MVQNSSVCEIKVPDLGMGYGSWDPLDTQEINDTTTENVCATALLHSSLGSCDPVSTLDTEIVSLTLAPR